jgi:uncharacterized protein
MGWKSRPWMASLAAIVLNPQRILPSQWLPWVWDMENGEASPEFADAQQANRIIGLLMRHYNTVAKSIDGGWFNPLLLGLEQPDGSEFFDAEGWCEGFMLGVSAVPDSWRAVLEVHTDLVAPMVMVLLGTDKGLKILEESGHEVELRRRRIQNAYEAIPAAVAALHEHFRPERKRSFDPDASPVTPELRRDAPKVGRNDPCPRGSGKKFKKCCGDVVKMH